MPPAGRYEGAVLALAALGSSAVRSVIWGKAGDGIRQVDELCGTLYPEQKKGKLPLLRALVVRLPSLKSITTVQRAVDQGNSSSGRKH